MTTATNMTNLPASILCWDLTGMGDSHRMRYLYFYKDMVVIFFNKDMVIIYVFLLEEAMYS